MPWLFVIPIALAVVSGFLFPPSGWLFGGAMGVICALTLQYYKVGKPYKNLQEEVRARLVRAFMTDYYPEVSFQFSHETRRVRTILEKSKLISADIYMEEDVIEGTYKQSPFYISEVHLKNKGSKNNTHTIFKGLLFQFRIPGRSFPRSRIQSKPDLLKRWFGGFVKNPEYGFWTDSEDLEKLQNDTRSLAPFIRHLGNHQGDVRLHLEGDQVTILMESKMKFLDEPKPHIKETFLNNAYFESMGRQLHTLLFILDAFVDDLQTTDIEDRLELIAAEQLKIPIEQLPDREIRF